MTSNGLLRAGKGTLYEGGVRVCAMAAWEGHIKPGTVVNAPLHIVDWYPTLVKLAGGSLDERLYQKYGGKDTALNAGIAAASDSELIGCLDADSFVEKNALREMIACFKDPKVGAATAAITGGTIVAGGHTRGETGPRTTGPGISAVDDNVAYNYNGVKITHFPAVHTRAAAVR